MDLYWEKIKEMVESLDKDAVQLLQQVSQFRVYAKGDYLLREGQICKYIFNINQGIARKFYLNDGKEITTEIYFKHDIAMSLSSFSLQVPSNQYIQALTEVKVRQIDKEGYEQIRKSSIPLMEFDVKVSEMYAIWLEQRLHQFHTLTASERYNQLLEKYPQVIQQIPLTIISSYLGVSLETLSRIRARH